METEIDKNGLQHHLPRRVGTESSKVSNQAMEANV